MKAGFTLSILDVFELRLPPGEAGGVCGLVVMWFFLDFFSLFPIKTKFFQRRKNPRKSSPHEGVDLVGGAGRN